jgi:hypothetical protein
MKTLLPTFYTLFSNYKIKHSKGQLLCVLLFNYIGPIKKISYNIIFQNIIYPFEKLASFVMT